MQAVGCKAAFHIKNAEGKLSSAERREIVVGTIGGKLALGMIGVIRQSIWSKQ